MKRDPDLIRRLLLVIEAKSEVRGLKAEDFEIDGFDVPAVAHHLMLMHEADLLIADTFHSTKTADPHEDLFVLQLSWKGHEYLDAIRDLDTWQDVRAKMDEAGVGGFEFAVQLARRIARKKIGLA